MSNFMVTVTNQGVEYYLRATTWTSWNDRADKFKTREGAQAAATKAEMFMAPKIRKTYKIVEVN